MKLTKLQQIKIEEMIMEEMTNLKEGWGHAGKLHNKSKRNQKKLFEATALETDLSESTVEAALEQVTLDSGNACVVEFDQELLNHILSVLVSHGLVESGATATTLKSNIDDYDQQSLMEAQQQARTDIATALSRYASEVAHIATLMYSGGDE